MSMLLVSVLIVSLGWTSPISLVCVLLKDKQFQFCLYLVLCNHDGKAVRLCPDFGLSAGIFLDKTVWICEGQHVNAMVWQLAVSQNVYRMSKTYGCTCSTRK